MMPPLLSVEHLGRRFGGIRAVDDLSFEVPAGSVSGVVGPNGAGKSTLIGLIGGALRAGTGVIRLEGRDITDRSAAARARLGIGRTYQIPRPFLEMTVDENLEVAQLGSRRGRGAAVDEDVRTQILERCGLTAERDRAARDLTLLRRKRLEVARALALQPRLLLLDEVGAGLTGAEILELIALIRNVNAEGVTILLVEHVLEIVRQTCARLLVLDFGRKLAEGTPGEVLSSEQVAEVYLGTARPSQAGPAVSMAVAPSSELEAVLGVQPAASGRPLLRVHALGARYGQIQALRGVSLEVSAGEAIAVLGPNGAGKTSLASAIAGLLPAHAGRIEIDGVDVTGAAPECIAALGIAQCLEGRRIFASLSVEENLLLAARGATAAQSARRLAAIYVLFPALAERRAASGVAMSGGQQQMLAIGRALMARPRLIVFDEISLGLAPLVLDQLYAALRTLKAQGLAMLIVEQDVQRALELADRVYVLEHGEVALAGTPAAIRSDSRLRHLYVGSPD
jgi:branched-chain amino acid transport system ATP-binding protein